MGVADGFLKVLKIAAPYALGTGAGAGTFALSGGNVPLAIGVGGTVAGQLGTAFDTRTRMQGATDQEIASAEGAARRSEGRRIEGDAARASRMETAQAASGGTLGSGLAARGLADVNAARGGAYADLNARLEAIRLHAIQNRTYVPDVGVSGIIARGIGTAATPFLAAGVGQALGPAQAAGGAPGGVQGGANAFTTGGITTAQAEAARSAAAAPYQEAYGALGGGQGPGTVPSWQPKPSPWLNPMTWRVP